MIKMQMIGHLGNNARTSATESGSCANFSVAHTEKKKDANGHVKEYTTWVDCVLWDRDNLHQYLLKGTQVYLEGFPTAKTFENRENKTVPKLRLTVFNIQLLGRPRNETPANHPTPAATENVSYTSGYSGDDPNDDLPF